MKTFSRINLHSFFVLFVVFILLVIIGFQQRISAQETEGYEVANVDPFAFDELTIRAQKNPVTTPIPTVSFKLTEMDLRKFNVANPEDAIKYGPNLFIRKRFIGDRNGVLSIRGASPFQNARSLVFVDGVTLSNLIEDRWNGAPKWQIVAPEEIVSTEILYGPYSAQYSGNSMNGVVNFNTRQPAEREVGIKTSYFVQDYDEYGVDDTFDGYQTFLSYGDRIGKLSLYAFYQHHENDAQPQSIAAADGVTLGAGGTPVNGAFFDHNSQNENRIVFGATSFNETDQDLVKLKLAYDFTEDFRAQLTVGYWDATDDDLEVENYLRDANGNVVWSGTDLNFNGYALSITTNPNSFSYPWTVETRDREDLLIGLTFEGKFNDDWDFQSLFTWYEVLEDERLTGSLSPTDGSVLASGRVQEFGDTYWMSYDFKLGNVDLLYDETLGMFAGYHISKYQYEITRYNSSNWQAGLKDGSLNNDDSGKALIHALYAQFDWNFVEQWTATLGARQEWWDASDGVDFRSGSHVEQPDRDESDFSPKFSLAFEPTEDWLFRFSLARAVRFPTITELFITDPVQRTQVIGNPQLEPEEVFAKTLMVEKKIEKGIVSLAYFHNDEKDTIFNQRVATGGSSRNFFVNLEDVLTQGIEFAISKEEFLHEKIDFMFNASYNDAEVKDAGVLIRDTSNNPVDIDGNDLPRVPDWRINMLTTYYATDNWNLSVGMRYATDAHDLLDNSDTNTDVWGSISDFFVWDFKTAYQFDNGLEFAFGIDNVFGDEYWMFHPFPERSYYFEGKWIF